MSAAAAEGARAFRPHRLEFRHTFVTLEYGPVGVIARVDRKDSSRQYYAGPLDDATLAALEEVAHA